MAGILTVGMLVDFLLWKGPLMQRRAGIAYISNVAVREGLQQKGIDKRLVAKAEAGDAVRSHCTAIGTTPERPKVYKGQGFKCIKVPEGANWPQPKTSPDIKFNFMMKLLL